MKKLSLNSLMLNKSNTLSNNEKKMVLGGEDDRVEIMYVESGNYAAMIAASPECMPTI
ncbi:MAG: hypothetical protein LBG19_13400 [Prevotellaceae bacterium]|jgi:hypothetical protein|nr:hypothetical protein [Prevotellaceae bacterium]